MLEKPQELNGWMKIMRKAALDKYRINMEMTVNNFSDLIF